MEPMTRDKFEELCESVLVPRIGDLLHRLLSDREETLEVIARELARIEKKLDAVAGDAGQDR